MSSSRASLPPRTARRPGCAWSHRSGCPGRPRWTTRPPPRRCPHRRHQRGQGERAARQAARRPVAPTLRRAGGSGSGRRFPVRGSRSRRRRTPRAPHRRPRRSQPPCRGAANGRNPPAGNQASQADNPVCQTECPLRGVLGGAKRCHLRPCPLRGVLGRRGPGHGGPGHGGPGPSGVRGVSPRGMPLRGGLRGREASSPLASTVPGKALSREALSREALCHPSPVPRRHQSSRRVPRRRRPPRYLVPPCTARRHRPDPVRAAGRT